MDMKYRGWLYGLGAFLVFLSEVYVFKFIGLDKISNANLSLFLANRLWLQNGTFTFRIPLLFLFFSGLILFLILKDGAKIKGKFKGKYSMPWIFGHIGIFISYIVFLGMIENSEAGYFVLLPIFYLIISSLAVSLVFGLFGKDCTAAFVKKFSSKIFASLTISFIFLNVYFLFQKTWPFFSKIVAYPVYFLLKIFYSDAFITSNTQLFGKSFQDIPTVGNSHFAGIIFRPCSGIEGLSLFLLLFTIIVIIDWNVINKKKMLLLYLIGPLYMVVFNILRIFVLLISGIEISKSFAVGGFHSNLGWIIFTFAFFVFLKLTYGWLKR